jgi:Flp pilus assembly protein TadB
MTFKSMKRQQKERNRNYLVYFSMLHLLVWLAAYFWFGWLGIIFGFLVNFVLDMGLLLIWMYGIVYKRHFLSGISMTIRWYRN